MQTTTILLRAGDKCPFSPVLSNILALSLAIQIIQVYHELSAKLSDCEMRGPMDERVKNLKNPDQCEIFSRNAINLDRPDLAEQARLRAVQLRAEDYGSETEAESEALQAVFAYEEALSKKNGKRTRASKTWQMIKRHGIIEGVERAVNRDAEKQGYTALVEMGLKDYAFEAVILRYPELFSEDAVKKSEKRLSKWNS